MLEISYLMGILRISMLAGTFANLPPTSDMMLYQIAATVLIVVLFVALKLFVGREPNSHNFTEVFIELPVEAMGIAITLEAVAFVLADIDAGLAFVVLLLQIIFAVVIVAIWRKSIIWLADDHYWKLGVYTVVSILLSGLAVTSSILQIMDSRST